MPATHSILDTIQQQTRDQKALLAVLLDPDKIALDKIPALLETAHLEGVHMVFVGSSQPLQTDLEEFLCFVKRHCSLPVLLFPGDHHQLSHNADALLFLSLISGRNPDYLIGQHVASVPFLMNGRLEIIPTGYILIDGGRATTVQKVSQTAGMERDDVSLIVQTAKAGEWLGMKLIYLEAGSGALFPVPQHTISAVKKTIHVPLIVGGGIDSAEKAGQAVHAGADVVVIGNILEKKPRLLKEIARAIHHASSKVMTIQ